MARYFLDDPADGGGTYWTDGWDGYAPARNRLLGTVAQRKVPGVVVLGGDVHANYVADLKADYDDTRSPVVASEFCGTSITSLSLAAGAHRRAARAFNPHVHYGRGEPARLHALCARCQRQLQMQVRVVDALRPGERRDDRGALHGRFREARGRVRLKVNRAVASRAGRCSGERFADEVEPVLAEEHFAADKHRGRTEHAACHRLFGVWRAAPP